MVYGRFDHLYWLLATFSRILDMVIQFLNQFMSWYSETELPF